MVEIAPAQIADLARLLAPHFYAPQFVIEDAVRKRGQFNAIHLEVAFKVDLWLLKDSPYDAVSFQRRLLGVMFDRDVWVSSAEDVILSKLRTLETRKTKVDITIFKDIIGACSHHDRLSSPKSSAR